MKGNCITKMYLSKRNFNFFCQSQKFYQNFYQGVWLLLHYYLTLTKVSQVNNMSKSQCCPESKAHIRELYYYLAGNY